MTIGDIVAERCEETRATIEGPGGRALSVPTEVMDVQALRNLVDSAHKALGVWTS